VALEARAGLRASGWCDRAVSAEAADELRARTGEGIRLPRRLRAGVAKYLASEYCSQVIEDPLRIHGGYGFSGEYAIDRLYREAPTPLTGERTADLGDDDRPPPR
jgi:alkylation response protein AidB-like acyl-CoA dehydrogenase